MSPLLMEENEGTSTTIVNFKDSINSSVTKYNFDENLNEEIYEEFDRMDDDEMMSSESEGDDIDLTLSDFIDIFDGINYNSLKDKQKVQDYEVQMHKELTDDKQKCQHLNLHNDSDVNNEKEYDRKKEVSNVSLHDSVHYPVHWESMEEILKVAFVAKQRSEDDSSMDIDIDNNQENIGNGEYNSLQNNNSETLSNKKENTIKSKYNDKLQNLPIQQNDVTNLENDSIFSSNDINRSLQDANMDENNDIENNKDFERDDLNEFLKDGVGNEGGLVRFNCNICSKKCKYEDDFKNHMFNHGVNKISCNQCAFVTTNIIHHQEHIAKHETELFKNDSDMIENEADISENETDCTAFTCKLCTFKGTRTEDLDRHMKSHIKAYSCDNCEFSCYKRLELKRHLMSHVCLKKLGIKKSSVLKQEFLHKAFKCDQCTFSCVYEKDFIQHTKSHFSGKSYNCHICDYGTDTRKSFLDHIRTHTATPYNCLFCQYSCHKPSELSDHVSRRHTEHRPYKCEFCDYTCKVEKILNAHLKTHREKEIKCYYCDYVCTQKSDLTVHTFYKHREHFTAKTHSCEECGKEFIQTGELKRHQWLHTKQYPNQCSECDYSCKDKRQLESHIRVNHTKKEKTLKCTNCDFVCFNHTELKRHSVIHTDKRYFSCEHCDYVSRQKKTLQQHQLKEHNEKCIKPETKAKCSKCDYVAIDSRELKRHLVIHTDQRFFNCEHCEYVSRTDKSLTKHNLNVHNCNDKQCTKCEYIAKDNRELIRHSVVHTDEKFFICEHCEYVCRNSKTLRAHTLKEHNTKCINPKSKAKCSMCEYVAINIQELRRHSVIHTGEKYVNCEHCDYVCKYRFTLSKHKLKQHHVSINKNVFIFEKSDYIGTNKSSLANHVKQQNFEKEKAEIYEEINTNIKSEYFCDMKDVLILEGINNVKIFTCGKCEFSCIDKAEICQHILSTHEKVVNDLYKCELCEYKSFDRLEFLEHVKDHTITFSSY